MKPIKFALLMSVLFLVSVSVLATHDYHTKLHASEQPIVEEIVPWFTYSQSKDHLCSMKNNDPIYNALFTVGYQKRTANGYTVALEFGLPFEVKVKFELYESTFNQESATFQYQVPPGVTVDFWAVYTERARVVDITRRDKYFCYDCNEWYYIDSGNWSGVMQKRLSTGWEAHQI